jgi:hypothetical protein
MVMSPEFERDEQTLGFKETGKCRLQVGSCNFGKCKNKQDKIDPKLGFVLLNGVYNLMLCNY